MIRYSLFVIHSFIDILYVITDLHVGGVPLHLYRLAVAVRAQGFTPTVVSLSPCGPVATKLKKAGVGVHSCDGRGGWDFRVIRRLTLLIRQLQPKIIHSMLFHANLAARLAVRRAGLSPDRLICEIQTVEMDKSWHLTVDRWTHRLCRFTIGNSPSVVEHLALRGGISRERLRLVRGGIDLSPLRDATPINREVLGLPAEVPIVLWVGRLDPVKGLTGLVDAFHLVSEQSNAHLVLVGDGPQRLSLEAHVKQRGLRDRVHLLGTRADVPALVKTADVFAFPSRTEGLPNALLEAMAAGCAIVTTDVPGCRDLIEHDQTGLLVPYGDTDLLAGALLRLLRDPKLARRLGTAAAQAVGRDWTFAQTLSSYFALYREVLAASG